MTFTNNSIRAIGVALMAVLFVMTFIAVAPQAKAADLELDSFDFYPYDYGDSYDFYPYDYGDSYDFYPYDYSNYSYDYPDYQYDYPDYQNYSYDSYYTPSFSSFPSYSTPSFTSFPSFSMPFSQPSNQTQNQNQAQSQSQSSNNNNVNNNVNNINISVPQAQQNVAQPFCPAGSTGVYPNCVYPTLDICPNIPGAQTTLPTGYTMQNGNCQYYTPTPYPTPAPQPYVTLSQVPYTGLELGPVGTAIYWGFLVLWSLMAAYLIAVKKVQNKIAAWFTGATVAPAAHTAHVAPAVHAPLGRNLTGETVVKASVPSKTASGIDPFIQSQIDRLAR